MNTNYKSIILAIGLYLALSVSVSAAPGDLDWSFGSGGKVITPIGISTDLANSVAIQSDGKIVAAGYTVNGDEGDFAVIRYNTDGSLDTSFGGTGKVVTPIGNHSGDAATSVAIQSDGKIVAAGYSSSDGLYISSFAVVRYNADGSLDTSFGGTGKVVTQVGSNGDASSVAIQADGKILAAGTAFFGTGYFAVVRYNTDGSLDTSFGDGGAVVTPFGSASSVVLQMDGKVVIAGSRYDGLKYDFAVLRYNTDGTLDTSFGGTGIVITELGGSTTDSTASDLAIQTDGRIVVVGSRGDITVDFAVVRYNIDGTLDTSFGGTGKVVTQVGSFDDLAQSVAIQSDGRIVAAGGSNNSSNNDFAVVRYNTNGSLDTTFGGTGKVVTPVGISSGANSVAIQSDGRIVAAGGSYNGSNNDFALVRYQGGSNANIRTRFDFDGDGKADISVFRPSNGVWYLNQSANGFSAAQFGLSTDKITPADYDGDGRTDVAVYRGGIWYLLRSTSGFTAFQFGTAEDIPQPADFNGDGKAELAVYRPSNGVWYVFNLVNSNFNAVQFGLPTDKAVVGDYDGDGRADYAVYRPSNGVWYLLQSTAGFSATQFGISTDKPVPADYDGDGKTDPAVYRDGTWYLLRSQSGFTAFQFGNATDIPAPADYDGDGKSDAAVYRDGTWHLLQSTNGFAAQQFGLTNDKPVPAAYLP